MSAEFLIVSVSLVFSGLASNGEDDARVLVC